MEDLEMKKEILSRKSKDYLSLMDSQVSDIKSDLNRWGKVLAVAGGAMIVSYWLFSGKKDKFKKGSIPKGIDQQCYYPEPYQQESGLLREIKHQAAFMIVAFAKQKLVDYLSSLNNNSTSEQENS
jgi:hypothetical protein